MTGVRVRTRAFDRPALHALRCRMYWQAPFWKIGHAQWMHSQPHICMAGTMSDVMHPSGIPADAPWYEHKGRSAGHDCSGDPNDFKPAEGHPHVVHACQALDQPL